MSVIATWKTKHAHIGKVVEVHDCVASTNTLALERSREPDSAGLALLAREQNAGRGQHGRHWHAPPGSSALLSVILFPPTHLTRPVILTAWAAVSVCATISEATGLRPRIKWPNDVLIPTSDEAAAKKVCGILIEQRRGGADAPPATVVGIGLNVRQDGEHFAKAGLPLGGSLYSLSGQMHESDVIARLLLAKLDENYDPMLMGNVTPLERTWVETIGLLSQSVTMETANGVHQGQLIGLSFSRVELNLADGDAMRTTPETVKHLHKHSLQGLK